VRQSLIFPVAAVFYEESIAGAKLPEFVWCYAVYISLVTLRGR